MTKGEQLMKFIPREVSEDEVDLMDKLKLGTATVIDILDNGLKNPRSPEAARYKALAITSYEQASMWANKAITE